MNKLFINHHMTTCEGAKNHVLFLHGFGGSIASFKGLQTMLSDTHSTINIDLPGFGLSQKVPSHFNIYDYAKVVKNFLEENNIKKVDIVSHSFGGRIALILASEYPELVDRLVLIDSAGIKPRFSPLVWIKVRWYKFLKRLVKTKLLKTSALNKYGSSDYKMLPPSQKAVFVRVVNQDLKPLLKNIKSKTLIIWGKKDRDTPLYMAKLLNKKIKNSALIVLEGAGHYSYIDCQVQVGVMLEHFLN